MLNQSRREKLKANAASGAALAWELGQDKQFRKRLLSAIEHGAAAGRRAHGAVGLTSAVARLAGDRALLKELGSARAELQQAYARLERKRRSHRLRKVLALGLVSSLAIPQVRRRVTALGAKAISRGGQEPELEELTREELYQRAQEADVPGRSEMTKEQLVAALRRS
jgi:hypothetical protein